MRRVPILSALLLLAATSAAPAFATTITFPSTPSGNGSTSLDQSGTSTFITFTPEFQQFDPSLGTLTSAELDWSFTGTVNLTLSPFPPPGFAFNTGHVAFHYGGTTSSQNYDTGLSTLLTFAGPSGSLGLNLAAVTGLGTFANGDFTADYTLDQGTFPGGANGEATGNFLVTYIYTSSNDRQDPSPVPEPASLVLLGSGISAIWKARRRA